MNKREKTENKEKAITSLKSCLKPEDRIFYTEAHQTKNFDTIWYKFFIANEKNSIIDITPEFSAIFDKPSDIERNFGIKFEYSSTVDGPIRNHPCWDIINQLSQELFGKENCLDSQQL
jgi:hypothetical protein